MRNLLMIVFLALVPAFLGAQSDAATEKPSAQVSMVARAGVSQTPYHVFEVWKTNPKGWIFPDIGVVSFGNPSEYREFFAGFGKVLVANDKIVVVGELYYLQADGSASDDAKYVQPWILGIYNFTKTVRFEGTYFPYLPLDDAGTTQHVLERAKVEKVLGQWKVGAGYSGYQFGDGPWQDKPFVTGTYTTKGGLSSEVWLQSLPHGKRQVQLRFFANF